MEMTVMSEGLLLNSKYIQTGREEGGFQALLTQLPLVNVCMRFNGYSFTALRPQEELRDQSEFKLEGGVEEKLFFIPYYFQTPTQ